MTEKTRPFCPHLTNGQIVSFGLNGMLVPVGEADVQPQGNLAAMGNSLKKRPASLGGTGGLDLSQMGKKLPVYQVQLGQQYKTPEGADPKAEDPVLIPTAAMVPCQQALCAYWCIRHAECREICNRCKAEAFALALQSVNQGAGASDPIQTTEEGPGAPEEKAHAESRSSPSPA